MIWALQDRLALADVKIQHGWVNISLDTIEPKVDVEPKRRRSRPHNGTPSDISSRVPDRFYPTGMLESSQLKAPMLPDGVRR